MIRIAVCLLLATSSVALADTDPLGQLLTRARDARALERIPKNRYYQTDKGPVALSFSELKVRDDHIRIEHVDYLRTGGWRGSRFRLGYDGTLQQLSYARSKGKGEPLPADVTRGTIADGVLTLETPGRAKRELKLPAGAIVPESLALFVLPALYDLLPEGGLSFHLLTARGRTVPGFSLKRGARVGAVQTVLLGEGTRVLTVSVDAKFVITQFAFDTQVVKLAADDAARQLIKQLNPEKAPATPPPARHDLSSAQAAVRSLIAACAARDLDRVAACFSANSPGEFKSIRDKTVSAKDFAQLCELFEGATITGMEASKGGTAVVMVQLKSRKEQLSMVKEGAEWRVLDF